MVSGTDSYTSPIEVGDALANAGFDVIASAGSHSDDYGVNYLNMTLDFWKSSHSDLTILGLHSSQEEADTIQVKNVNGIRVALLDYAFGSNYDALPEDYAYMVDYFEKEKVTSDIEKAKEISDCIIVLAQWGTQGYALPDEFQKEWAQYLLSQGVTVLVGSHPHVLQPYEMLSDDQGNEMLVYYSLGDFVTDSTDAPSLLGGLARFTLEKTEVDGETKVKISDQTLVPTVMHYNTGEQVYQTMLLSDYTDELAQAHSIQAQEDCPTFCVASLEHLFDYITQLTPGEAASTQLLDLTYQADGSMVGADGSMLSADEIEFHYPIDTSGSMDALKAVLNEVEASNTYSQDDTSDDAEDDSLLDSEYNSDDEDESLW
jgi:poly-gamma-glutamate synthesis protein (capsule biosynthesis protein)